AAQSPAPPAAAPPSAAAKAAAPPAAGRFQPMDMFGLEWASDPQISPDGRRVAYVRTSLDVMKDLRRSQIWLVNADGTDHRPLTSGAGEFAPRWSPDGRRLVYAARDGDSMQLFVRWMDTGATTRLAQLQRAPGGVAWSPDGKSIAFTMLVPAKPEPLAKMPEKPEGADWAKPPRVITRLVFRADGEGFIEEGFSHLFVVPSEGGTPRPISSGSFHHDGAPAWTADGKALLISANRRDDWEYESADSEIYEFAVADGAMRRLTDRRGPDTSPVVSPDGRRIAYLGYDDRYQGYQVTRLYMMNRDGSGMRLLTGGYDRDIEQPMWSRDGKRILFATADRGNGKIGSIAVDGAAGAKPEILAADLGGGDLGRPYSGGSYSVARADDRIAYTWTRPDRPPEVAVAAPGAKTAVLTSLNDDLFAGKTLATVEEIWTESSFDHRRVQGWIMKPPGFDPAKKYPMILEIHGGPFADYGDRFGAELQLYAAAGYVVLYGNPRGSTSYGEEFGNLIHHAYPGNDYDDLMSLVDATVGRGYVDPANLFVTGGSGGGVLTAWIVGKTDRFRAAVSAKPVINWYSFVLTADETNYFTRYWFASPPWENPQEYLKRSPLSYVGNVKTPTMLLTGEADYRTPIAEAEQFYEALKMRKVDTALVRVPDASHGMFERPSMLLGKSAHILAWFEKYRKPAA
ncbi:MAG TPA: S9 family peptidase, partial [Candidatus Polarisedimenticolia bacterium]|nr:S9 family peptidase [Candidatus Polarisedimenticolia bacterium]